MADTVILNNVDKHRLVYEYAHPYGVLVETGLWQGGGVTTSYATRLQGHVIDLDPRNCDQARKAGVTAWCGDSGDLLPHLLHGLSGPACFWLDAHLVASIDGADAVEKHPVPLLRELLALIVWEHGPRSTVLVDDLRLLGSPGWPTRETLAGLELGELWAAREDADILRLTPNP